MQYNFITDILCEILKNIQPMIHQICSAKHMNICGILFAFFMSHKTSNNVFIDVCVDTNVRFNIIIGMIEKCYISHRLLQNVQQTGQQLSQNDRIKIGHIWRIVHQCQCTKYNFRI